MDVIKEGQVLERALDALFTNTREPSPVAGAGACHCQVCCHRRVAARSQRGPIGPRRLCGSVDIAGVCSLLVPLHPSLRFLCILSCARLCLFWYRAAFVCWHTFLPRQHGAVAGFPSRRVSIGVRWRPSGCPSFGGDHSPTTFNILAISRKVAYTWGAGTGVWDTAMWKPQQNTSSRMRLRALVCPTANPL